MDASLLAVDPGLDGALVFFPNRTAVPVVRVMPTRGKRSGREVDAAEVARQVKEWGPTYSLVERVGAMPGEGRSSVFSFGLNVGILLGACAAVSKVARVVPRTWQGEARPIAVAAGLTTPEAPWTKEVCSTLAQRLYPQVDLRRSARARKVHDGIADALLIGRWGLGRLHSTFDPNFTKQPTDWNRHSMSPSWGRAKKSGAASCELCCRTWETGVVTIGLCAA